MRNEKVRDENLYAKIKHKKSSDEKLTGSDELCFSLRCVVCGQLEMVLYRDICGTDDSDHK